MPKLVRFASTFRQVLLRALPMLGVALLAGAAALDVTAPLSLAWAIAVVLVAVAIGIWRGRARVLSHDEIEQTLAEVELSSLAIVILMFGLGRFEGTLNTPTFALIFLVLAVASVLARPISAGASVLALVAIEGAVRTFGYGDPSVVTLVMHGAIGLVFAGINHVLLRAEVARLRSKAKSRVEAEIHRLHEAARSYRLLGATRSAAESSGPPSRTDEERLARSSVEEIHQAVMFSLDLVRRSLGLNTAMLLWLNNSGTHLRIAELSTDSDDILEGPFLAADGIFGAALAQRAPVSLSPLRPGYKLPYFDGECPVKSVCAVPVYEHNAIRGLLVVDRTEAKAFDKKEEELLVAATRHAARAIQNERVFIQLERAKVEQGKLYRAAEALGAATTETEVIEAAVKSAREIAAFDFGAITIFDVKTGMHEIRGVSGDETDDLLGVRFATNAGLVSMVVENKHPLPYKGEIDERQVIFSSKLATPSMASVLVLPLMVHDRPLGTLVLGARRRGAFGDAVRPTLEVLARHVAVSLANARMVKKLEELATTDGLTGLLNKRAMFDLAKEKIAAAKRFNRKLSVLVTDIDFFKKVNDTHGHDVGDVVIKGLGKILSNAKRATDAVARFGGEEFVVICEETDQAGALLLAERVREELGKTAFPTPSGPLRVNCSIGIATFPEAGQDWDALFKAADEALYVSKRTGRDRSTVWSAGMKSTAA
ncbi:MAG: sensor domain-containing diguanylate cyclase [Polyangiaceae bacterium]